MNSNEVILEVGRLHLQIVQLTNSLNVQANEIADLNARLQNAIAPPAPMTHDN